MKIHNITTPVDRKQLLELEAGDMVAISGEIYTARDAAHKLIVEGSEIPFDLNDLIIYYAGPSPAPHGKPIGSIGPTTSSRMDAYTPAMLSMGVAITIGKGPRSDETIEAFRKYNAVYLAALGGAGALLASKVNHAEIVAFSHLGPEAIYKLEVEDFPAIVAVDTKGNTIYK
ncbi:MAG TPA: FumA C-terminus/TtdB family hydratase beta subunit [Caldisericia bacterium]|nr:FumA C-terminus/TtdB family hydratase beta subunit [Caldisericia bacterium]HPF49218.1 FumA C-terminus/TtdB family hydratase beta subunit [Caldisericia bacterium]HPI84102.1 FumA C-terminus/TtdB family hydratase beta subunit [Caldisericia bacterium]HPQ93360.1 FumA C-terminus/TtdB family hydratase beta subunit [Caldisericia bacterium]HRV75258.1 FumA C-terminus/TtdB family hydratase beta subunit [Caldisericia bacterium]